MSELILRPYADSTPLEWTPTPSGTHCTTVDETSYDDADYVAKAGPSEPDTTYHDLYGVDSAAVTAAIGAGDTINHVHLVVRVKRSASPATVKGALKLSSSYSYTDSYTDTSFATKDVVFTNKPGGTGWTRQDVIDLKFGFATVSPGFGKTVYGSWCYLVVDYTPGEHPLPTSLKCDGETTQANAYEVPFFTAQLEHNAGGGNYLTHVHIDISTVSNFASYVSQSGWIQLTGSGCVDGAVCEKVFYNRGGTAVGAVVFSGTGLNDGTSGGAFTGVDPDGTSLFEVVIDHTGTPDSFKWRKNGGSWTEDVAITGSAQTLSDGVTITFAATTGHTAAATWSITAGRWTTPGTLQSCVTYYYRLKCKDATSESAWSATGQFSGLQRSWAPTALDYVCRKKLLFPAGHAAIPNDYTARLIFKTGNRYPLATDGAFNESVQASGGWQIDTFGNATYQVYLSKFDTATENYGIKIKKFYPSNDPVTVEEKFIAGSGSGWDTHYFPTICIDPMGYIHVFISGHNSQTTYYKSTNPEDITAWTLMTPIYGATTYPVPFVVPHEGTYGRMYVFFRDSEYKYGFSYKDLTSSGGGTWTNTLPTFIHDTYSSGGIVKDRIYAYGFYYDKNLRRLNVAFTYNQSDSPWTEDYERGVWFIYSDYDDRNSDNDTSDIGFNVWRWPDGDIAGYTDTTEVSKNPVGYYNSTTEGWEATVLNAIVYADNDVASYTAHYEAKIFIIALGVTLTGQPIVFWEQKIRPGQPNATYSATDETDLCSATWSTSIGSAGSWVINWISQDKNLPLRVRRSSIGVMTDINGVVIVLMPVCGQTWWRIKPNADITATSCTKYPNTGEAYYADVDDGLTQCDGDSTYLTIASGGKYVASHAGGFSVSDGRKIYGVRVHAIVRKSSSDAKIKLLLNDGATDNKSSELTIDHTRYEYVYADWDGKTNPFTSVDWTASDVNALRFGIENTGSYNVIVTRLLIGIKYTLAADYEWFGGGEIYKLISIDDGVTWSTPVLETQNTAVGIPILNNKHHVTNDIVEFSYSCGNNIFVHGAKPYGYVKPTCDDLKIYCGNTEIDRVIDYADATETEIHFRIQDAIAAGARTGSSDYYVYYANKNAVPAPLSDPHNVYLLYESWEQYKRGDVVNTVATNWTIDPTDAGTIYSSPPAHGNKAVAGKKCCELSSSASLTIDLPAADLSDIYVEVGIWEESSSGDYVSYIELQDTDATQICRVGGKYQGSFNYYAAWYDGYAWHYAMSDSLHSVKRVVPRNMNFMAIQLTSQGITGWYNQDMFCCEVASVHSSGSGAGIAIVDKVQLATTYPSTFIDFFRVMYRAGKSNPVALSAGSLVGDAYYSIDSSEIYEALYDKLLNFSVYTNVVRMTVTIEVDVSELDPGDGAHTHYGQLYLCRNATYNDTYITKTSFTIVTTGNTNGTKVITYENLNPDDLYSLKLDYYQTNYETPASITMHFKAVTLYQWAEEPFIEAQAQEMRGFAFDVALLGAGKKLFRMMYAVAGYTRRFPHTAPVEYKATKSMKVSAPVQIIAARIAILCASIENQQRRLASSPIPMEYQAKRVIQSSVACEWFAYRAILESFNIAYDQIVQDTMSVPVEYICSQYMYLSSGVEWTEIVSMNCTVPVEIIFSPAIQLRFSVEYIVTKSVAITVPLEYQEMHSCYVSVPCEWFAFRSSSISLNISYEQSLTIAPSVVVEYILNTYIVINTVIEVTTITAFEENLPVEYSCTFSCEQSVDIEYLSLAVFAVCAAVEWQENYTSVSSVNVECLSGIYIPVCTVVEFKGVASSTLSMPVEYSSVLLALPLAVQVEYGNLRTLPVCIPIENTLNFVSPLTVYVEAKGYLLHSFQLPVEYISAISMTAGVTIEYLQTLYIPESVIVECRGFLSTIQSLAIEYLETRLMAVGTACENMGSITACVAGMPIEYLSHRVMVLPITIECRGGLLVVVTMPVEFTLLKNFCVGAPIEYLECYHYLNPIPLSYEEMLAVYSSVNVEFFSYFTDVVSLPVEYQQQREINISAIVSFNNGYSYALAIPVSYDAARNFLASVAVEYAGIMPTFLVSASIEYQLRKQFGVTLPIDYLYARNFAYSLPIGFDSVLLSGAGIKLLVEYSVAIQQMLHIPVAYGSALVNVARLPVAYSLIWSGLSLGTIVEYSRAQTYAVSVPVEYTEGYLDLITLHSIPVEYTSKMHVLHAIPAEWKQILHGITLSALVDYGTALQTVLRIPIAIESTIAEIAKLSVPVDWRYTHHLPICIPVEYVRNVVSTATVNVDYGMSRAQAIGFAIEYGKVLTQIVSTLTEWLQHSGLCCHVCVEYKSTVGYLLRVAIEYRAAFTYRAVIPIAIMREFLLSMHIPVEFLGAIVLSILLDDIAIHVPTLSAVALLPATFNDVIIKCAAYVDHVLIVPVLDDETIKDASITDAKILGQ